MEKSKTTKLGSKSEKEMEMEKKQKKTGLGSTSEKEQEIEDLLTEEEELEANYKRLEKQGMSDQIANVDQLKELGKDVYEGAKKGVKKVVKKVKEAVKKVSDKDKK